MFGIESEGSFDNIERFLKRMLHREHLDGLEKYAQTGVEALSRATPVRTGKTAASWDYEIHRDGSGAVIYWTNSNENKGERIALLLQYGHGTRNGGYYMGLDYINPAMRPVFDKIAEDAWEEVTSK